MATKEPKHTIKGEIERAYAAKESFNANTIAKAVGVSRHRVLKFCKSHGIDIKAMNEDMHKPDASLTIAPAPPRSKNPKRVQKTVLKAPQNLKIALGAPRDIKVRLG